MSHVTRINAKRVLTALQLAASESQGARPTSSESIGNDTSVMHESTTTATPFTTASAAGSSAPRAEAMRRGTWILLEVLARDAGTTTPMNIQFILDTWATLAPTLITAGSSVEPAEAAHATRVLATLRHLAANVPASTAAPLAENLLGGLLTFEWPATVAASALQALTACCVAKAPSPEAAAATVGAWSKRLLDGCTAVLRQFAMATSVAELPTTSAVSARLFMIGELAMLAVAHEKADTTDGGSASSASRPNITIQLPPQLVTLVQALIAPRLMQLRAEGSSASATGTDIVRTLDFSVATNGGVGTPAVGAGAGGDEASLPTMAVPDEVRAHAFVALGKLCMLDLGMAKEYIQVFVRELQSAASPMVVRNNILFVLSDLCVRHTQVCVCVCA